MLTRVQQYKSYRNSLNNFNPIEIDINNLNLKHLIIINKEDKKIETKVDNLNEYEKNKLLFTKYYKKKKRIYYTLVSIFSLIVIVAIIVIGIYIFK